MCSNIKFGTDGWRSVIADDFTFANVRLVTKAVCEYLKEESLDRRGIFIGYDNRFLSEDFAACSATVLNDEGLEVFLASESVPTPVTAFMVKHLGLDGAFMFTASHNPPKYNGIKFIPDYGGPADQEVTKKIEEKLGLLSGKKIGTGTAAESKINHLADFSSYADNLLKIIDRKLVKKARPRVGVDTMFGAGSRLMPRILNEDLELGAVILNDWRDPLFGGRLPDPSEENLKGLLGIIREKKLDLGIALDGDADRFGVIDGKGVYISPNNVIALILYYLTEEGRFSPGDIAVRSLATTHLIDEICRKRNMEVLETPVGFKHIGKAMLEGNVLIGGEESGGLSIKGHIPEKDGLLANLLLLEIQSYLKLRDKGSCLSDYLQKIYGQFGTFYNIRLDLEVSQDKKAKILDYFSGLKGKDVEGNGIKSINRTDGVKLLFEQHKSWLLVRPSGTEPLIRCYIETTDRPFFELLKNFVKENINNLIK
ncbi:MAG: phosphoglucomutase/phosphomannomutase family protein [Actinomycetota bacterium]